MRGVNGQVRPKSVASMRLMQGWDPRSLLDETPQLACQARNDRVLTRSQFHNCW